MLIISESEVQRLLPMSECIEIMSDALKSLARGEVLLPLRPVMWLPDKTGALAMMPSYSGSLSKIAVKIISVFPGNRNTPYDSHQGAVLLFDSTYGQLLATIDASSITAIRTAAVSGVATKLLAREDASDLAILGSGVQARTHLESMLCSRNVTRIRIWSRNRDHACEFVKRESERHGRSIEIVSEAKDAVRDAEIICTTTSSQEPVLFGNWIAPGAHINAVGASVPSARELSTFAVAKAKMFVDRLESALKEAGDFLIPKCENVIDENHIVGEIGDVLLGRIPGRISAEEITLFKSVGIAVEDLAAAQFIYEEALKKGIGVSVELGGIREGH